MSAAGAGPALRIPGQVTLGIAGGSGAGKSTIAAAIVAGLAPLRVELLGLDRFFKPAGRLPRFASSLHGEPRPDWNQLESLDVEAMVAACSRPVDEADVVLLDGHQLLCYAPMRELLDVKLFVDADLEVMLERRTRRNLDKGYGGGAEEIAHYNRDSVTPGYRNLILPSRAHADVIIPNHPGQDAAREAAVRDLCDRVRDLATGS